MKKFMYLLLSMIVVFTLAACGETEADDSSQGDNNTDVESNESENVEESTDEPEETEKTEKVEEVDEEVESETDDVPREHKNALKAAQNYIDIMPFSEKGLFEQLTSEYGDQYPEEAAQYALDNIEVDYNEEALEAAVNYQDIMPMSDQELFEQLTSEYGDQFTEEQAQYALDNLPE